MKYAIQLMNLFLAIILLSSCAESNSTASSIPSLSGLSRPTSRQPSPSNFQRNNMMDSSRMMLPQ